MADQIVLIKWDDGHNAPGPWYIAKIVAWNKHDEPHEFKDIGGLGVDGGIHRFDSTLLYFWRYCNDTEILYIQEVQKPFNIHVKRLQIINNKSVKMYDYFNPNEEFTMCYNTFDIVSIDNVQELRDGFGATQKIKAKIIRESQKYNQQYLQTDDDETITDIEDEDISMNASQQSVLLNNENLPKLPIIPRLLNLPALGHPSCESQTPIKMKIENSNDCIKKEKVDNIVMKQETNVEHKESDMKHSHYNTYINAPYPPNIPVLGQRQQTLINYNNNNINNNNMLNIPVLGQMKNTKLFVGNMNVNNNYNNNNNNNKVLYIPNVIVQANLVSAFFLPFKNKSTNLHVITNNKSTKLCLQFNNESSNHKFLCLVDAMMNKQHLFSGQHRRLQLICANQMFYSLTFSTSEHLQQCVKPLLTEKPAKTARFDEELTIPINSIWCIEGLNECGIVTNKVKYWVVVSKQLLLTQNQPKSSNRQYQRDNHIIGLSSKCILNDITSTIYVIECSDEFLKMHGVWLNNQQWQYNVRKPQMGDLLQIQYTAQEQSQINTIWSGIIGGIYMNDDETMTINMIVKNHLLPPNMEMKIIAWIRQHNIHINKNCTQNNPILFLQNKPQYVSWHPQYVNNLNYFMMKASNNNNYIDIENKIFNICKEHTVVQFCIKLVSAYN